MPTLSIIVPTFNRGGLLREAVASILRQQCPVLEIIISDDGSRDDTVAVCRELQQQAASPTIIISRTEINYGAQVARNRGLDLATGEAVMFLDSDDVLADNGLPPLLQALDEDPRLDYVFGKVVKVGETLLPLLNEIPIGSPFSTAPVEVAGYHWAVMGAIYRRNLLKRVGDWNEELTGSQDWEYQSRVKLFGGKGEFVDTLVGYWRQHKGTRVGAKAFRPDYVTSVMIACNAILTLARNEGRCDGALELRLAKKLILHALEWGANGYRFERNKCFLQAANSLSNCSSLKAALFTFRLFPSHLDGIMWKILTRGQHGKPETIRKSRALR